MRHYRNTQAMKRRFFKSNADFNESAYCGNGSAHAELTSDKAHVQCPACLERLNLIRCYDNGGATADRYTVVYMDQPERMPGVYAAVGMNAEPFHPQGIGQHVSANPGRHLGRRVPFRDLPKDCQKLVTNDTEERGGA